MMTDAEAMLEDCMKRHTKLTDYEMNFINSLSKVQYLTVRQYEILENLWERIT